MDFWGLNLQKMVIAFSADTGFVNERKFSCNPRASNRKLPSCGTFRLTEEVVCNSIETFQRTGYLLCAQEQNESSFGDQAEVVQGEPAKHSKFPPTFYRCEGDLDECV